MEAMLLQLVNMSLTGCVLIVVVLSVRALLKKAPRWSICLLWGLVAFRLICPFTLESEWSLIADSKPISEETFAAIPEPDTSFIVIEYLETESETPEPEEQKPHTQVLDLPPEPDNPGILTVAAYVWMGGAGVMLLYALVSYLRLKRMVSTATRLEKNIRQSEYVTSPFVLGVLRPMIYLPYGLKQPYLDHILAHERTHIRRGDHLIKPFGFLVLSLHWFNPLVWVAYVLLCRDIEAACDERVIKTMTKEQRQSYSATLLRCSVHRRRIAACPVAFGETGVKQRIKGIMSYKKPVLWIVIVALLAGAATGVCFLTERPEQPADAGNQVALARMEMDALLDTLLDHADDAVVSDPEACAKAKPEAYEKLLGYDDLALSYFIPRLRKADVHSYREYMMAYVCGMLTGINNRKYAVAEWWEVPQRWIAEYDRTLLGDVSGTRVCPGGYESVYALKNDANPYYGEFWEGPSDADQYFVTAEGLTRVYPNHTMRKWDNYHSYVQTVREKVEWQWESADGVGAPQTERAQQIRQELNQSLKFLEGTEFEELLTNDHCLFQPLERGACMVLSNDRLFWIQSDYYTHGYRHIYYVKMLSYCDGFYGSPDVIVGDVSF